MRLWLLVFVFASIEAQNSFNISNEDNTNQQSVYDVIIVGGGLTGLTAAKQILRRQPSASVVILEARGQVGGRIRARTVTTAAGDEWLDLGSQFISPKHNELINLIRAENIQLSQQAMCGHNTVLIEGVRRRKRQIWTSSIPARSTIEEVLASPDMTRLGNMTVGDFTLSSGMSDQEAAAMNRLLQTLYDAPENKISPLTLSLTAGSDKASIPDLLMDFGHGSSFLAVGSMYNVVRSMADGIHVEYNQDVTSIQHSARAVVTTTKGVFQARQVLVTAPPKVAARINFSPSISSQFSTFLDSYSPKGDAFYFTMTFPTAFWRAQNRNGQIIYTSSTGRVAWLTTFDVTTTAQCESRIGTTGVLWGIAHVIEKIEDDRQRHQLYIDVIAKTLGSNVSPIDVKDVQFSNDSKALGSIGGFGPMTDFSFLQFLKGVHSENDVLHFASAEYSNKSMGLMNGAVNSGNLAAETIIERIRDTQPATSFQYDQPLLQQGTTSYVYTTSTHYPPTTRPLAINIILASASSANNNSIGFSYSTSTHYPTTRPEPVSERQTVETLQRDQSGFRYETSTHYPSTSAFDTTTMTHFSMGNQPQQAFATNNETQKSFDYVTTTHYPPFTQTVDTGIFEHFSLGNEKNETSSQITNLILGPAQFVNPSTTVSPPTSSPQTRAGPPAGIQAGSTTPFVYSTSTPATNMLIVTDSNFQHFSLGNLGSENSVQTDLLVAKDQVTALSAQPSFSSGPVPTNILTELKSTVDEASNSNQLSLATKLSSIVQNLLQSIMNMNN
ncbi:unnamed protein product [Auanema sp. JU1783]|nr:unnamed protein product [Auanema sp. JU1783]